MHGMIYGAQQTIKLIRLCVFPEEGPAGGCSRPSSAPSLFEPPLPSTSLPPESLEHFFFFSCLCFCLAVPARSLLQLTREAVSLARPERRSGPLRHWPDHRQGAKANCGAPHNGPLSAGLWLAAIFTLPSLLHLPQTPNLRRKSGCGMMPIEGAHCFTSCPIRHTPERLYPTGS